MLEQRLNEILYAATGISARSFKTAQRKGMAAINIQSNPYTGLWEIKVNWSDNSEVKTENENLSDGLDELEKLIIEEDGRLAKLGNASSS